MTHEPQTGEQPKSVRIIHVLCSEGGGTLRPRELRSVSTHYGQFQALVGLTIVLHVSLSS